MAEWITARLDYESIDGTLFLLNSFLVAQLHNFLIVGMVLEFDSRRREHPLKRLMLLLFQDLSDSQWRTFRAGLPALTGVMAIFTILAGGLKAGLHLSGRPMAWFWLILSLSYIAYLHGACVVFILAIAISNFAITKAFGGTRALPILIWTFNIGFLVANRVYEGYRFSSFGEQLAHLDQYRGVMRWQISFNFVILRMLSFSLDYHWARILRPSTVNWEVCPLLVLQS
jgi:hypothetical protein